MDNINDKRDQLYTKAALSLYQDSFSLISWGVVELNEGEADLDAVQVAYEQLQAEYDGLVYARDRKAKYDLLNQDEMRFDDQANSTTTWVDAINAIKAAHPKP